MAGEATYTWTEADYTAGLRAQMRLGVTRRTWIVMAALAVCGVAIAGSPKLDGEPLDPSYIAIGLVVALFLPLCIGAFMLLHAPRITRRVFRQQASLSRPVTVAWDDETLQFRSESGHTTYPWATMHYWAHRDGVFLFAANERLHYMVPDSGLAGAATDFEATADRAPMRRR